jgi:membrane protease YdiL (CAAX protease family)
VAVLAVSLAGGARVMAQVGGEERYATVALPVALGLAAGALLEELLFRGFPLARLGAALGAAPASLLLAAGFVAAHLGNPALSWLGLANIGLASLLLSAVFFSPAGLPGAVGLHFGWNAGLALVADAPVSGLRFGLPVLEYAPGAHGWLTGGPFGPEGGLAATAVMGLALWWWGERVKRGTEVTT